VTDGRKMVWLQFRLTQSEYDQLFRCSEISQIGVNDILRGYIRSMLTTKSTTIPKIPLREKRTQ
jgi:hypothetical protein